MVRVRVQIRVGVRVGVRVRVRVRIRVRVRVRARVVGPPPLVEVRIVVGGEDLAPLHILCNTNSPNEIEMSI